MLIELRLSCKNNIDMIKEQEIVVSNAMSEQKNANEDVKLHAKIDGGDILNHIIIINCPTHLLK